MFLCASVHKTQVKYWKFEENVEMLKTMETDLL